MAHGSSCNCMICKIGKGIGMIKKEESKGEEAKVCECGSGKPAKECCAKQE